MVVQEGNWSAFQTPRVRSPEWRTSERLTQILIATLQKTRKDQMQIEGSQKTGRYLQYSWILSKC